MRLETERLILRPVEQRDADALFPIMNDPDVSANTLLPHPYPKEHIPAWLIGCAEALARKERYVMAVELKDTREVMGTCAFVRVNWAHLNAELVYWLGKPYWGKGYVTEAARRMLEFGFHDLRLERICGGCFTRNAASKHVLEKIGMKYEGCARHEYKKGDEYFDTFHFALTRRDFRSPQKY